MGERLCGFTANHLGTFRKSGNITDRYYAANTQLFCRLVSKVLLSVLTKRNRIVKKWKKRFQCFKDCKNLLILIAGFSRQPTMASDYSEPASPNSITNGIHAIGLLSVHAELRRCQLPDNEFNLISKNVGVKTSLFLLG